MVHPSVTPVLTKAVYGRGHLFWKFIYHIPLKLEISKDINRDFTDYF